MYTNTKQKKKEEKDDDNERMLVTAATVHSVVVFNSSEWREKMKAPAKKKNGENK